MRMRVGVRAGEPVGVRAVVAGAVRLAGQCGWAVVVGRAGEPGARRLTGGWGEADTRGGSRGRGWSCW